MDLPDIPSKAVIDNPSARICIVGAGPGGLAALKAIRDAKQFRAGFWKVTAFEAREDIGGIWLPAQPIDDPPLTALYDSLTTNLPHPLMAYPSFPFPPSTPVYPKAAVVKEYLDSYAKRFDLYQHICFNISVQDVRRNEANSCWKVTLSNKEVVYFDSVIIANGHYRVPRYPNVPGLSKWLNVRQASHSAWYRSPHNLGKKVLVVGAGPSGQDIAAEMRTVAEVVVHSISGATSEDFGAYKRKGRIREFKDDGCVVFADGSSEKANTILHQVFPPLVPPLPRDLYNSTYHVFPLAKHLFPLQSTFPPHSLAFMCLFGKLAPLPVMEAQALAIVHAFANPDALNPTQEAVDVITRYENLRAEFNGDLQAVAKIWHKCRGYEQFDYRDDLMEFALKNVRVQDWEKEMYDKKDILRQVWRELETSGEAEEWVRGAGERGPLEWVNVLRRMLRRADEQSLQLTQMENSKL